MASVKKKLSSQPTPRWMRVTARAGATSASSSFNRKNQCTQLVLIGSVALFLLNRKSSGRLEQHKEEPCGSDNLVLPPPPLFAPTLPPSVCSLPKTHCLPLRLHHSLSSMCTILNSVFRYFGPKVEKGTFTTI